MLSKVKSSIKENFSKELTYSENTIAKNSDNDVP